MQHKDGVIPSMRQIMIQPLSNKFQSRDFPELLQYFVSNVDTKKNLQSFDIYSVSNSWGSKSKHYGNVPSDEKVLQKKAVQFKNEESKEYFVNLCTYWYEQMDDSSSSTNALRKNFGNKNVSYNSSHNAIVSQSVRNDCITYHWLAHNMVQFMIQNNLQTPLGDAVKSLRTLQQYLKANRPNSHRYWHYIQFLDLIEKYMFDIYNGSTSLRTYHWICALSPQSNDSNNNVVMFFIGNRKMCELFFNRDLRPLIVEQCSKHLFSQAPLIYHATEHVLYVFARFHKTCSNTSDGNDVTEKHIAAYEALNQGLYHLCHALLLCKDSNALCGVKDWFLKKLTPKSDTLAQMKWFDLTWIQGMICQANEQLDDAIVHYQQFMSNCKAKEQSSSIYSDYLFQKCAQLMYQVNPTKYSFFFFFNFFQKFILFYFILFYLKCHFGLMNWAKLNEILMDLSDTFELQSKSMNESLRLFDKYELKQANDLLSQWEIDSTINPIKGNVDISQCDKLYDLTNKYHLQSLLYLHELEALHDNKNNQKEVLIQKLRNSIKHTKVILKDPLKVASHGSFQVSAIL
ncbi:hypothetical protein RFI_36159 [Reticulomyxa filosa]|uniref:Uncharacterized protein n=1 Tax=Reticulomyxa filosa TaxID=46433 RepID=X6LI39_RETFI|nr:hypothetical protein RFI_36159 [Reticulomyxa filosa]|eukprot:ETO01284.1 hypothetical protein RFI_36159 [Reticulomyxa filosa]